MSRREEAASSGSSSSDDDDSSDPFARRSLRTTPRIDVDVDGGDATSGDSDDSSELLRTIKGRPGRPARKEEQKEKGEDEEDEKGRRVGRRRRPLDETTTTRGLDRSGSGNDDDSSVLVRRLSKKRPSGVDSSSARRRRRSGSTTRRDSDDHDDDDDSDDTAELLRTQGGAPPPPGPLLHRRRPPPASAGAAAPKDGKKVGGQGEVFLEDPRRRSDDDNAQSLTGRALNGPRAGSPSSSLSSSDVVRVERVPDTKRSARPDGIGDGQAGYEREDGSGSEDEDACGMLLGRGADRVDSPPPPPSDDDASSVDTAELALHVKDPVANPPARSKRVLARLRQQELQEQERERQQQQQELKRQQALRRQEQERMERQQQQQHEDAATGNDPSIDEFRLGDDDDDDSSSCSSQSPDPRNPADTAVVSRHPSRGHDPAPADRDRGGDGPEESAVATRPHAPATTTPEPETAPTLAFLQRPERSAGTIGIRSRNNNLNRFTPHSAPRSGNVGSSRLPDGPQPGTARSNPYRRRSGSSTTNPTAPATLPAPDPPPLRRQSAPDRQPHSALSRTAGARPKEANQSFVAGPRIASTLPIRHEPLPSGGDVSNEGLLEAAFWHENDDELAQEGAPPAATVIIRQGLRSPPAVEYAPYCPPPRPSPLAADDVSSFSDDENNGGAHRNSDTAAFGFAPSPPHPSQDASRLAESTLFGRATHMQQLAPVVGVYGMGPPTSQTLPPAFSSQPLPPNPSVDDYKSMVLGRRKRVRDAVASNPLNASGVVLRSAPAPAAGLGAAASQRPRPPHPLSALTSLPTVPWRSQSTAHASAATTAAADAPSAGATATRGFSRFSLSAPASQGAAASSHSTDQAWSRALASRTAEDSLTRPWRSGPTGDEPHDGRGGDNNNNNNNNNNSNVYYGEEEEEEEENFGGNRGGWETAGGARRGRGSSSFRGGKGRGARSRSWRGRGFGFGRGNRGGARTATGGGGGRPRGGRAGRNGGGGGGASNRWAGGSGGGGAATSRDDPNLRHVGGADMSF